MWGLELGRYGSKKMRKDASRGGGGWGESNGEIRLRVLVGLGGYMKEKGVSN